MTKRMLSLFDRTNHIRNEFIKNGYQAHSLDSVKFKSQSPVDYNINILEFNYTRLPRNYYSFIFIALPCTVYSMAAGNYHYKNNKPITKESIEGINILIKVWQIVNYFKCDFVIENPTGGLINNIFFKSFFNLYLTRVHLKSYGYPTPKQTDLFSSFNLLLISTPVYRVNGRYNNIKFDKLPYYKRIEYPPKFVKALVYNIVTQLA